MKKVSVVELFAIIDRVKDNDHSLSYLSCRNSVKIDTLVGKVITDITMNDEEDMILIQCDDGSAYVMCHDQECCESVYIEDINGDMDHLIGSPITKAEERVSGDSDHDGNNPGRKDTWDDCYTWIFYTLATVKGYVDIRWYGTSNGYYSESVDFVQIK